MNEWKALVSLVEEWDESAWDEDDAPEENDADEDEFKEFVVSLLELNISLESAVSLEFALFISAAVLLAFAALKSALLCCSIFRTLK